MHLAQRRGELGPLGPVVPQQPRLAGRLVPGDDALRVEKIGLHGKVDHLDRLDLAAQLPDGGALVSGPGEDEGDHGGGQH